MVFATWTIFLIHLVVSQRYVAFLRPEFGILLAAAHLIAMGFMLAAMVRPKAAELDMSAVLRALVLLVPVLYAVVMPDTMLGNQAFKKRFIGNANPVVGRRNQSMPSFKGAENNPGSPASPGEIEGARQETPQERTILELFLNPDFYKGRRVIVTGMILRDEKLKPYFGGLDTAVYRFLITCCAADALPLAIALDSVQTEAFANDQWVQVDGIFGLRQTDGKPAPVVSKAKIRPIEPPAVPYLF